MPKKGKIVLAIMLGGKAPKGKARNEEEDYEEEGYEEEEGGEYSEAFAESAEAAFDAANAGDKEGFVSSLKDAILTCLEEQGAE